MVSCLFAFHADKSYKLQKQLWWLAATQQQRKAASVSKINVTVYNVKRFVDKKHSISEWQQTKHCLYIMFITCF